MKQPKKNMGRRIALVDLKSAIYWLPVFFLFSLAAATAGAAQEYHVSPRGSDGNPGTARFPWASFDGAVSRLQPGDTLILEDGLYRQSLLFNKPGANGKAITVRARNDGRAIVDGEGVRIPLKISYQSNIRVEGIVFKNSNDSVIVIQNSRNITLRRVSGYDAGDGNCHIFDLYKTINSLIEDCAAGGRARVMYDLYECNAVTVRRCWGRFGQGVGYTGGGVGLQIYGSNSCTIENNIVMKDLSYTLKKMTGIQIWANTYNHTANNNKILGNIVLDANDTALIVASAKFLISGNHFKDNVVINANECFRQAADNKLLAENLTCVNGSEYHYRLLSFYEDYKFNDDFAVSGTFRNSSFYKSGTGVYYARTDPRYAGLAHKYNNYYGLRRIYGKDSSEGPRENTANPGYDSSTYGKGAYLTVPSTLKGGGENGLDIGAVIIYQYRDGNLTAQPLWPWPMEDRIFRETGVGVTWESQGGIWKTLKGIYPNLTLR